MNPDKLQQYDIFNDRVKKLVAYHCISAVLYHNNFTGEFLYIRQRFDKRLRALKIIVHVL
jgi:hypothetical protein